MAKEFVQAHLSPATYSDTKSVKFPDGTVGETLPYAKTFSVNVTAPPSGNLYVYILPFVEVPLATWNGSAWTFYSDPNMGSQHWMSEQGIYGFRCLGQSCTAYNTTAEIYKQGNVTAAVVRSCVDRHEQYFYEGDAVRPAQLVMIDGIPMSSQAVSSNSKHPYIGRAAEGCYVVNRNYGGFDWIFRNSINNKASTSTFATWTSGTTDGKIYTTGSYLVLPVEGSPALKYQTPVWSQSPGTLETYTVDRLSAWLGVSVPTNYQQVSGFAGNNYGVGVMAFTGLSEQTTFTLKFKHIYEFLLKPGSPYTPLTSAAWPQVPWVEEVIRKQLSDKPDAFDSSANFLGAILQGIKHLWPYVAPLVVKGARAIASIASRSIKKSEQKKPKPEAPRPPAKPQDEKPKHKVKITRQNGKAR